MNQETYNSQAKVLLTKRFARMQQTSSPKVAEGVVSYGSPIPKTKEQLRLFQSKSLPVSVPALPKPVVRIPSPPPPLNVPTIKVMRQQGCGGCGRKLGGQG